MTRINVGILPSELCDQMLIAEIHELPRVFKFRDSAGPEYFTLGKGHVLWCARHHVSLVQKYEALVLQANLRGFKVSPVPLKPRNSFVWLHDDVMEARALLIPRIKDRLSTMKRKPTWTNATKPDWVTQ